MEQLQGKFGPSKPIAGHTLMQYAEYCFRKYPGEKECALQHPTLSKGV